MELAVPLTQQQVDTACRLHQRLTQWRLSNDALLRLRDTLPVFDLDSCLLKTVVINTLYGTQVLAILRMAQHVHHIFQDNDIAGAGPQLVEKIASLPDGQGKTPRRFVSFAAKFCHFFVDEGRFPIYDEAARKVIELHLRRTDLIHDATHPYVAFCENLGRLQNAGGLNASVRDLDRYLWLTGMYMKWLRERRKSAPQVNVELLGLFTNPGQAAAELDAMLPAKLDRAFRV